MLHLSSRSYVRRARRAPLHAKLTLVYTLVISVFVVVAGIIYGSMTAASIRNYAREEASQSAETLGVTLADGILLENQGALRARGDAALAVISTMGRRAEEQGVPREQVEREAADFLAVQQIGEAGYFFVVEPDGDVVYHPYQEVAEANQAQTPIVQRILEQRSGFVRYDWQNPGEEYPRDKLGYVTYFESWQWYIVATDYASGFLDRLPPSTLQSLLNGYRQESVLAAFVRTPGGRLLGTSGGWQEIQPGVRGSGVLESDPADRTTVRSAGLALLVARSPLEGFDAEVGVVYSVERLQMLTTRYVYIVAISLIAAIVAIAVASRVAGRFIARPVQLLSERLTRRLGGKRGEVTNHRVDDLRGLVLQQLRALVRLDYESQGRRAAEREAMVAESVFQHTTEGIVVADPDGTIVRVNPAMEAITGYRAAEIVGQHASMFKSKRHEQSFYQELWQTLLAEGAWVGEMWSLRKNGEEYPQLISVRAVRDEQEAVESFVAVCHDISERKEAEDRLHYLATHDSLTGLPNRTYLNDVLDHTLRRARRSEEVTAVLFLDIDDFKDVNDSHGHDTGDQLLKWIARRLEFQLREEDLVVRFGGDEFVIVLPGIEDADYASVVARRILAAVRDPYLVGSQKIRPSVSIGIAIYPEAGREASDLLRDADAAMYAAKRQGRNTYRFHNPGMNENAHRRLAMQGSVASAIDNDEFRVVYQPILSLAEDRIAGAEALVRWVREGRLVMPGEFLPYLENSSMLTRLDLWVLDQVCLDMNTVSDSEGEEFFISVNAGAYNLIQDDFVTRVTETVARNGVDPSRIAIEVTETAAIRNFDRARATLRELQAAGFKLYLDDFGEGHSSIRYLREFGVDSVKLDRTYVTNVEHSEPARSLVSGFTQLAHGMRLQAVIEGVETQGQLDFIREAGCDFAQGFLLGMPGELTSALR